MLFQINATFKYRLRQDLVVSDTLGGYDVDDIIAESVSTL